MPAKTAHIISFYIGVLFLAISFYLAFFAPGSFFYTSFTIGSWLVLDYIDYHLNNTSILSYFYNHKHRYAFYLLFLTSFFACFTVDFIWGVQVLQTWEWIHYSLLEYIRMYAITNITFVLSMYELYRVIQTLLKKYLPDENLVHLRAWYHKKDVLYALILLLGIIFLISPVYFLVLHVENVQTIILPLPFVSITLIADSITYFTGGRPILEDLVRVNKLKTASIICTVVSAFIVTEGLNVFGREWKYLRMPFYDLQLFNVPLSVLIGWIPLVVGLISMVNMTKHLANATES